MRNGGGGVTAFALELGALSPLVSEQLKDCGASKKTLQHWDNHATAITRLVVHGLLTEAECIRARKRLISQIQRELQKK